MDDSPANLFILGEILSGIDRVGVIDKALSGEEGIQKIIEMNERGKKAYDLILIDMNMPTMDGIEVIKELKLLESKGLFNLSS